MDLLIRSARDDERPTIAELYWAVWHATQAPLQPAEIAAMRDKAFFVDRVSKFPEPPLIGLAAGALVGFAACQGNYLGQLYLVPSARGMGVGHKLLDAAENAMRDAGHDATTLRCHIDNPARGFYERHGWSVASTVSEEIATARGPVSVSMWLMTKRLSGQR